MSTPTPNVPPEPIALGRLAGVQAALRYTGLPTSWLTKRPKLPSRNWLIFLSVTSTATGYYIYDRRECKRIRQHYIDLVKDRGEDLVKPLEAPRRVTVYGAKWPGDEDYDQAMRYFRKYLKPILVASAVDYDMIAGKRHGDIVERVANDIRLRRRRDLGIDPIPETVQALPTYKPPEQAREQELKGGIVIIGRQTLKEFMAGLKKGWSDGVENIDHDEVLARELASDGHFDEVDDPAHADTGTNPAFSSTDYSPVFSPLQIHTAPSLPSLSQTTSGLALPPPDVVPSLPPLLLVPFTDYIGFTQIPVMLWDWFNQRHKVRAGAEAAYRLIMSESRALLPPEMQSEEKSADDTSNTPVNQGDLDFDKQAESWYKSSLQKRPTEIEKERRKYYEDLPARLATARALARGTREPTKDESNNPPPTEVELSAERMKKEKRWRRDLTAWDVIKPAQLVAWDERFRDALRIFVDPSSTHS